MKINAAVQKIEAVLKGEFDSIGEKIRAELQKAYHNEFVRKYDAFISNVGRLKGRILSDRFDRWTHFIDYDRPSASKAWDKAHPDPKGSDYKSMPPHSIETWEQVAEWKKYLSPALKTAKQEADDAYENARDGFVTKNVEKVKDVLGDRSDLTGVAVNFRWRSGVFDGTLKVTLSNAEFSAHVGLKYVVRTVPRITPYYQYPLLFTSAMTGGKITLSPSQEELRILLGGGSDADVRLEAAKRFLDEGYCAGGGQEVPAEIWSKIGRMYVKTARCTVCGASVAAPHGKYLKHKTPAAAKQGAAQKLEAAGYCPKSREKVSQAVIDAMGPVEPYKDPKVACEHCGQLTRLDAEKDWIPSTTSEYPTHMKVKSAKYYKHKLNA